MILVIKFFERFRLNVPGGADAFPRWGVVTVKQSGKHASLRIKNIDREEALELIRENGLVVAHSDRDGVVYDTPDKLFQERYRGVSIPIIV